MRIHRIGGNCVLLGPMLIPEWTEFSGLFGIAGNRVLLAIFASLLVFLGLIASIFVTFAILFSEYHKVCSFGN